jgi:quinol monooxygenase YgiN
MVGSTHPTPFPHQGPCTSLRQNPPRLREVRAKIRPKPAERGAMTVMNVVHMRVKPGQVDACVAIHESMQQMAGMRSFRLVKSGERSFIVVGEWDSQDAMVAARPAMIANLDQLRPILEDLGGGRGVTEPWSGEVVLQLGG